jgi:tetratricopeptide (TPR) repeat protein
MRSLEKTFFVFLFSITTLLVTSAGQQLRIAQTSGTDVEFGPRTSTISNVHENIGEGPELYGRRIEQGYAYHFGQAQPFLPSNVKTENGTFISPLSFPTAEYCGHCHIATYRQWKESAHRNSFRAPFYKKNVDLLIQAKGIEYSRHCEGCHNPIALTSGALTPNSTINRSFDEDGITCSVCHSITKLQANYGIGSYVMGVPSALVDESGNPIPGEVPDSEILAHLDRHRQAVMRAFYKSPEFCGSCHKANLPKQLNGYKWLRAIGTYDEWQNSSLSHRSPLPFYKKEYTTCQKCHMPGEQLTMPDPGAKAGILASHRWLGGNTAIPFYYRFDEQLRATTSFLQNKRLGIDIFGLKDALGKLVAPLGSANFTLQPGATTQVLVVIQNKGLGHSFIPEQRDFYEAWVEFDVTDRTGRELCHSGFLKEDGVLDEHAHSFTNRLLGKEGEPLLKHEVWDRRWIAYDNTIAAGRSTVIRYKIQVPEDVKGPLTLRARVNYRHFNQRYLTFVVGPKQPRYPVIEMAAATLKVEVGGNDPTKVPADAAPEWMRWNNYGIGLLEQNLYQEAADAFAQVVRLRPDYGDGFTNIGIADLRREDFLSALSNFNKALGLDPDDRRALFFRALAERANGEIKDAASHLEIVELHYPESADVHRELGQTYYLLDRDRESAKEFESVQECDPDDVPAHYYLSLLYRRLGLEDKAKAQAKLYLDKRDDRASSTAYLQFLKNNPSEYQENLPSHLHSDQTSSLEQDKTVGQKTTYPLH